MKRSLIRTVPVLVLSLALACGRGGEQETEREGEHERARETDHDDATRRQAAMSEWYNEGHHDSKVGLWSVEYRKFMLEAAAKERLRWDHLMPRPEDSISSRKITGSVWTNIGPTRASSETDSGRVRSIVTTGNRLFVATAGGGVWRSDDQGGHWTPLTETLGALATGSLAADPSQGNTLYLGLGDPFDGTGIGLVKSTDGGDHWSAPIFLGDSTIIPQVLVAPGNTQVVLAATDKGLYRSTNAGASYSQVNIATGLVGAPVVWSLASTGAHSLVLSLGQRDAEYGVKKTTLGQVWTSTDDGATWTRGTGIAATMGRISLASAPSNRQVVYAQAGNPETDELADLLKSTNGGVSWTALHVASKTYTNPNGDSNNVGGMTGGQAWYDQLVLVNPTNPNQCYFGGNLALVRTSDGGNSFSVVTNWAFQFGLPYVHADFHAGTFDADGNLYVGTDGGIFLSTDNGAHFTDALNIGIVSHLMYSVGSSPANPNVVIGGLQDNGTRLRVGNTSTFDEVLGGDGFGVAVHQTNAQQLLGTTYNLRISRSNNGGQSFNNAVNGIPEAGDEMNTPFITAIVPWMGSTTGNDVYTYSNTKIYRSTNFGSSWSVLGTPVFTDAKIRGMNVAKSDRNIIGVAGSGGRVALSRNGGASWTLAATGKSPDPTALPNSDRSISYIEFDHTNPDIVYVASVAPDAARSHLWRSTDFGAHWTAIDGGDGAQDNGLPRGVPINVIRQDPKPAPAAAGSILYAATHLGIYRSQNAGLTWARFGTGMPLVNVTDMYISPDEKLVRASTFGRGFWELKDSVTEPSDFSIGAAPTAVTVSPGESGETTISTTVATGGAESIALFVSGLPAGASAAFHPTSVSTGGTSTLTLTAGVTTPAGTYPVTVTGTSASATHATTVTFVVELAANDFSIAATPDAVTVEQGASGMTSISTTLLSGSAENIALTATGLPAGTTATFVPTSISAGGSSMLTLSAGLATPPGEYAVTVTGTAAMATHSTMVMLTVTAKPAPTNDFTLSATPTTVTVEQGASGTTSVSTAIAAGVAENIAFTLAGLPAGATATFAPTGVDAGANSTLTLAAAASTPPGTYALTVTGTAASAVHTTAISLIVTEAGGGGGDPSGCGCTVGGRHGSRGALGGLGLLGLGLAAMLVRRRRTRGQASSSRMG